MEREQVTHNVGIYFVSMFNIKNVFIMDELWTETSVFFNVTYFMDI